MRDRLLTLLRGTWRKVPPEIRSRAVFGGVRAVAPRRTRDDRLKPGPVAVAGLFGSASGIGESARLCLDVLRDIGCDARHKDLTAFFLEPDFVPTFRSIETAGVDGGTLILHINSPSVPYVAFRLGRDFLAGRRLIGCWVWELPVMPPDWRRGMSHVHEIWVPSRFVAGAVPRPVEVPVRVVPYPVRVPPAHPARDRFGLTADAFVVLTAFDMLSGYSRKNPRAAIVAFRRAFGDDAGCLLVLKVGHAADGSWATEDLHAAIAGMGNVRLIRETLPRDEVAALTASADVVLSLHRAEGFGLVLAEAMLLGVPVVATGWSGNIDFMTGDDSALISHRLVPVIDPQGTYKIAGALWAEPDVDEAASWLRRLRADANLRATLAARARTAAVERFSPAAYRRAIGDALG